METVVSRGRWLFVCAETVVSGKGDSEWSCGRTVRSFRQRKCRGGSSEDEELLVQGRTHMRSERVNKTD